jgi:hypothetical protein
MQVQAIISRVQEILLKPKAAWAKIDGEPVNVPELYKSYIAPLAAIPPVATFIGFSLLGMGFFRMPIGSGLAQMIFHYVLSLVAVYAFALIIDYLAPQFGAQKNFNQAFKVAAYASTASWIAGIFTIIPALAILSVLGGLYSLYLLFVGLPMLMKPPEDKATTYTVASIGVAIVLSIIIGLITSRLFVPAPVLPT